MYQIKPEERRKRRHCLRR